MSRRERRAFTDEFKKQGIVAAIISHSEGFFEVRRSDVVSVKTSR